MGGIQLTEAEAEKLCVPFANVADLRRQVAEVRGKIRALGNVNVGAIEEYKEVKERYDFMKAQVTDVEKSRAELNRMIAELCSEMQEMFTASFKEINRNFGAIFRELFGGGSARLYLSDENDVLNSGIEIQVSPPGKVIKTCRLCPAANRRWWPSAFILPFWPSTRRRSASWTKLKLHWTM